MQEITGSIGLSLAVPEGAGSAVQNNSNGSKPASDSGFFDLLSLQSSSAEADIEGEVDPLNLIEAGANKLGLGGNPLPQGVAVRPFVSDSLDKSSLTATIEALSDNPDEVLSLRALIAERLNLSESNTEGLDYQASLHSILSEHLGEGTKQGEMADLDLSLGALISKHLNQAEMQGDLPNMETPLQTLLPEALAQIDPAALNTKLRSIISEHLNTAAMNGDMPDLDLSLHSILADQLDGGALKNVTQLTEQLPDLKLSLSAIIAQHIDKTPMADNMTSEDLAVRSMIADHLNKLGLEPGAKLSTPSLLSDQLTRLERGAELQAPSLSTADLRKLGIDLPADVRSTQNPLTPLEPMTNLSLEAGVENKLAANIKPELLTSQTSLESPQNNLEAELIPAALSNEKGASAVKNSAPAGSVGYAAITEQLGHQNWNDNLASRVKWMLGQELQEAKISLNPRDLGPLSVKINVIDDQAHVQFVSQHGVVRDAVEDAMPRLKEMLEQSGLMLADADVSQQSPEQQRSFFETTENSTEQAEFEQQETEQPVKVVRQGVGLVDAFV